MLGFDLGAVDALLVNMVAAVVKPVAIISRLAVALSEVSFTHRLGTRGEACVDDRIPRAVLGGILVRRARFVRVERLAWQTMPLARALQRCFIPNTMAVPLATVFVKHTATSHLLYESKEGVICYIWKSQSVWLCRRRDK